MNATFDARRMVEVCLSQLGLRVHAVMQPVQRTDLVAQYRHGNGPICEIAIPIPDETTDITKVIRNAVEHEVIVGHTSR